MTVAARLAEITRRIEAAGGDPGAVTIVAVTKGRPVEACREAVAAGLTVLGENRVQEGLEKMAHVEGATWHLIGHLQTNKVRMVVGRFALIQSLDSLHLAQAVAQRLPSQEVLLEVNIAEEPEKTGCSPDAAVDLAVEVASMLPLRGLMGMGPREGDPRPAFRRLAGLRAEAEQRVGSGLPVLSMGMSADYESAVAAGSTMLRLGRVLFEDW